MKVRFYLSASAAALVVGLGGPASADPVPQSGGAVLEEVGRTRLVREAVGIGAGELKLKERVALERQPVEALPPLKREPVEVIRRPIEKLPSLEKPVELVREPAKVKRRRLEAGLLDRKPTRVGTGKKQGTKIAKVKLKRK